MSRKPECEVAGDSSHPSGAGCWCWSVFGPTDDEAAALRLLDGLLKYRIFADEAGKMNLSLQQISGDLLLVPQFTLAADTRQGLRPGFSTAAPPDQGKAAVRVCWLRPPRARHAPVASGVFGAAHAGVADQRRTGNYLAGELSFCKAQMRPNTQRLRAVKCHNALWRIIGAHADCRGLGEATCSTQKCYWSFWQSPW